MIPINIEYENGTHAGELDSETLEEIWDHLYEDGDEEDPEIPDFDEQTLEFFEAVNGIAPVNLCFGEWRIVRFLNFCNDYYAPNAPIVNWQIVRVRSGIADRLSPLMIPFAEIPHGNYLCFDFSNSESPKIVRWDHEKAIPGQPACEELAANLDEFLEKLTQEV